MAYIIRIIEKHNKSPDKVYEKPDIKYQIARNSRYVENCRNKIILKS